jgi:hypothetical protein
MRWWWTEIRSSRAFADGLNFLRDGGYASLLLMPVVGFLSLDDPRPRLAIAPSPCGRGVIRRISRHIKAKEFDAKDAVTEKAPGSNPSDDRDAAVLEDHGDAPVLEELNSLSEDEQMRGGFRV